MSFRKFGPNDIVLNTMRAFPQVRFDVYNFKVYYNNTPHQSGAFSDNILGMSSSAPGVAPRFGTEGGISLHEYNIDRQGTTTRGVAASAVTTGQNPPIVPYITKDSARASFKTVGKVSYNNEFRYGDILLSEYPMTASITREFMYPNAGARESVYNTFDSDREFLSGGAPVYRHFYALKNRLDSYGYMSQHYVVSSSLGWNKAEQTINMISIPSIFYGSRIQEGSVSLRYYVSGTLQAELRDAKENGELIQYSGTMSSANDGDIAGVVLYNEGIILLTGSWEINDQELPLIDGADGGDVVTSKWIYFGVGANDIPLPSIRNADFASASFEILFNGQTETQVQTMFAHARRGEANYSNNPTFLQYGQDLLLTTGSVVYEENPNRKIKNTVSSSFATFDAPFKRQVYISRVGIYDKDKNLIGLATLSDPILKEEDEDYTFKLKLDI
jgi:hypothetical protein